MAVRAGALVLALPALAACGSADGAGTPATSAATTTATSPQQSAVVPAGCAATVMKTLGRIVERVYHEGVKSQRTGSAVYEVTSSAKLRTAVEAHDAKAARAAAEAIIHTGHITDLRLIVGGKTFLDVGVPAITPLRGVLTGSGGKVIADYVTSVWSVSGFLSETGGVIQGYGALREGIHDEPGSFSLGAASLPEAGTLTHAGVSYGYTSFAGEAFPSGPLRVYLVRESSTITPFCRSSGEATIVSVLQHIAQLIYKGERGAPAHRQVKRVEANAPLLHAVARHEPAATEAAIKTLLNQHIVRLRVFGRSGELLGDVGGPDVLAPVHGTLRSGGRRIGSFVLSVQDDEGYEKLAKRIEGLDVLVYYKGQIVKNSLGPVSFGEVPANGSFSYSGHRYSVFTVRGEAFPSGPVLVRVLVPEPYLAQPVG